MAPKAALPAAVSTAVPVKTTRKKPKQQPASRHPPVSVMVISAIRALKERHGSSLQAIRKYLAGYYFCDVDKLSRFIKQAIKNGVEKGTLVQTKGTGVTGRFKLSKREADKESKLEKKPRKKVTTQKKRRASGKKSAATAAVSKKQKPTKKPSKTAAVKKPVAKAKPKKVAAKK